MRLMGLILLLAAVAAAQCANSVDGSASRDVVIPADQAQFMAVVSVSLDTTQQQVAQAFRDLGVENPALVNAAAGVSNYSYPPPEASQFLYQITFSTPPAAVKDLAKKLDALRAKLPDGFTTLQYVAALTASSAAIESARRTVLPQLIAEARAKAQTLADAAGLKLGAPVAVSESAYGTGGAVNAYFLTSSILGGSLSSSGTSASQYTFWASVRFAAQ